MRRIANIFPAVWLVTTGFSAAAVLDPVGLASFWDEPGQGGYGITWTPLYSYDGIKSGLAAEFDFVGNANNPGLYYSKTADYVFFRMRVDANTLPTASGSYALLIDVAGYGVTGIDYAFAWDAKSNDINKHGLEMCLAATNGPTWGLSQLKDIDNDPAAKLTNDINGDGRTGDGYVRTTDTQPTVDFGTTTLIDFAVKWSFLETNTNLRKTQTWNVTTASIVNATDHNAFNGDVMGANLDDLIGTGWSTLPEPSSALAGLLLGAGLLRRRR